MEHPMTTVVYGVLTELELDLNSARLQLGEARLRLRQKDTPHNRRDVGDILDGIDTLLEMRLAVASLHG
jgi:hypothetical protein